MTVRQQTAPNVPPQRPRTDSGSDGAPACLEEAGNISGLLSHTRIRLNRWSFVQHGGDHVTEEQTAARPPEHAQITEQNQTEPNKSRHVFISSVRNNNVPVKSSSYFVTTRGCFGFKNDLVHKISQFPTKQTEDESAGGRDNNDATEHTKQHKNNNRLNSTTNEQLLENK